MSRERAKVLEMLAAGKITAEDAERLLSKLETAEGRRPRADREARSGEARRGDTGADVAGDSRRPLKFLRVLVNGSEGEKVNIRVPLALVRTGIKLSTMMPSQAHQKLTEKGIDLSHLSSLEGEALIEALRDLEVDVDSGEGDVVRIFCE